MKQVSKITIGHPTKKAVRNKLLTTKYNAFDFVPRFLFAKFTEPTNLFFLILTLIKCIPDVSPFAWHSSGLPLAAIILFSAATEIYEDIKRRREDRNLNSKVIDYFDGRWKRTTWSELKEGHLVRINKGDGVPADILILSSSEPGGEVYMETANLDGESNLKIRQAPSKTMGIDSVERLLLLFNSHSTVTSSPPYRQIDKYSGVLELSSTAPIDSDINIACSPPVHPPTKIPLSGTNFIVRGASIQNIDWMVGVVIFAGNRTKIGLNATQRGMKRSQVHRLTNWMILIQIGWLITISAALAFSTKVYSLNWLKFVFGNAYEEPNIFIIFLGELILFSNLVPISLCVTIEFCLVWQGILIQQDLKLYSVQKDQRIKVRSFGTIPNLGRVKYVLSDKTGTLTTNKMKFRFCSIFGKKYGNTDTDVDFNSSVFSKDLINSSKNAKAIDLFLTSCAICHTVIAELDKSKMISTPKPGETSLSRREKTPKPDDKVPIYHACSPDEGCLVRFASTTGYVFTSRTPGSVTIALNGGLKTFEILAVVEFTSVRKRMAVLVRTPEGTIRLFVKGADTKILSILGKDSAEEVLNITKSHLEEFANAGYRTLCFAYKDVTSAEYEKWAPLWTNANCDLEAREQQVEFVAEQIEKDLILLGASAIEDKLQEHASQTIARMLKADIHVWILTGDKLETALNIGYSCSLLTPGHPIFILAANTEEETGLLIESYVEKIGEQLPGQPEADLGLIVDAHCLDWILASTELQTDFLHVALYCSAVICCRCTPLQKASITRLVRRNVQGLVLSIGDGANDVAMIREADVGVGIAGLEGSQASNSADFAITQFSHLDRLLFVHGTTCYYRITNVVLFSLYKNLLEVSINIAYGFFNGHSDNGIADEYTIVRFNLLYTCLPVLVLGIFDAPAPQHILSKHPLLYTHFQDHMSNKYHMLWSGNALLHAFLVFACAINWWADGGVIFIHGRDGWGQMFGSCVYLCLVLIVNGKALIESLNLTYLSALGFLVSIGGALLMLYSDSMLFPYVKIPVLAPNRATYLGLFFAMPALSTLAFIVLVCVLCWMIDVAILGIYCALYPTLLHHAVEKNKEKSFIVGKVLGPFIQVANLFGLKTQLENGPYGYMFSQDDGRAISQVELVRLYKAPSTPTVTRSVRN